MRIDIAKKVLGVGLILLSIYFFVCLILDTELYLLILFYVSLCFGVCLLPIDDFIDKIFYRFNFIFYALAKIINQNEVLDKKMDTLITEKDEFTSKGVKK